MAKLREKMEQALKTMPNFRDMKDHVEMTITVDGLRIELLETEAGMFFESGRPQPSRIGRGAIDTPGRGTRQAAQPSANRGPHRCQALCGEGRQLWELGTLDRPRQRGSPPDGGARNPRRTGGSGTGFRRPAIASSGRPGTPIQSQNLGDCAISDAAPRAGRRRRAGQGAIA